MDSPFSLCCLCSWLVGYLVFEWGEFSEGSLAPSAVVGGVDPTDQREAQLLAGGPFLTVETLVWTRLKKDSMAALSAQVPTAPIDWISP